MGGKVWVVGSMSIDYFTYSNNLPAPGETISGTKFFQDFGGKGANQAVAASRFQKVLDGSSNTTSLVACAGSDALGATYVERLQAQDGVETSHLSVLSDADTGTATINVASSTGENAIVIVAGANWRLNKARVHQSLMTGPSSLLNSGSACRVVVCQLEVPREATEEALRCSRQITESLSILNPAPAVLSQCQDNVLFELCDILVPNETEAAALSGVPLVTEGDTEDAQRDALIQSATAAARELVKRGCGCVLVTLGRHGAIAVRGEERPVIHVASPSVSAVDTSGAGDCFIGTFAAKAAASGGKAILENNDSLIEAMAEACCAASLSVQRAGTQQSYASAEEIQSEAHRSLVTTICSQAKEISAS